LRHTACKHNHRTDKQQWSSSNTINEEEGNDGTNEVCQVLYNSDRKWFRDTDLCEEYCAVIEDETYTGKLLPDLNKACEECSSLQAC